MRRKIENKKKSISISLDVDILNVINNEYSNRSKFIENCILEEMIKSDVIKQILISKKIIL